MNDETDLPDLPEWIPDFGCKLRKTGLWFDAVRIAGARGERVAVAVAATCGGEPGPIVRELVGRGWLYFVLPPGTVREFGWPGFAERFSAATPGRVAFVGIPALSGETWPLAWRFLPTARRPFVEPSALHAAVVAEAERRSKTERVT